MGLPAALLVCFFFFSGKQRVVVYLIRQVWERKRTFLKECKKHAFLSNLDFFKKRLFAEVSFGD